VQHDKLIPGMSTTIAVVVGVSAVGLLLTGVVLVGRWLTARRSAQTLVAVPAGEAAGEVADEPRSSVDTEVFCVNC